METVTLEEQFTSSSEYYDNSALAAYKECPRKYFLRHRLHWRSEGVSLPLAFGLAWHEALDVVWSNAKKVPLRFIPDLALGEFLKSWKSQGLPEELSLEEIERYGARSPAVAAEMLKGYMASREKMLQEAEVLASEQPFAVPLVGTSNIWYVGRLDKIVRFNGQLLALEHKSTTEYKKDGGFRTTYIEGWYSDSQVKGYQYGGALFFPGLKQVWVDAALVHKQVHNAFRFIPVEHQRPLLMEWVYDTGEWIRRIQGDSRFPKNEGSCVGKFGPCPFLDICRTTDAPQELAGPPAGYIKEKWEPFELLHLDKLTKEVA